ncbi:MAG: Smr/MutS family protein [Desulfobacteraceae bacterium]|nr:Smr/MutS family protein [Desulfobacteraceae bacterium]MCF8094765.1 Smr/MutS family protein [Desulfobacteraceae bacterium]
MEDEPVSIPITGELDLHTFKPSEVEALLEDYFEACLKKGIHSVRIIHGKGTGKLKKKVHAVLSRNRMVQSFSQAPESAGGWGATRAWLEPSRQSGS